MTSRLSISALEEDDLWQRVYSFNNDSHLALRAIGQRYFPQNAERIQADLLDDFQNHAETFKLTGPEKDPFLALLTTSLYRPHPNKSIELERKRLRTTALEVLADHPEQKDRELFLKFLSGEFDDCEQTVACLRGLSSVGRAEDREKIVPLLADTMAFVQAAAARAYLSLSPSTVVGAKDLLSEPSEYRVWVVVHHSLKFSKRNLWPLLKPLLHHEGENIRRLVCYYVLRTLKRAATERLLNEYLGHGHYFYNVVTILDRYLYAPDNVRRAFLQEEQDFFDKLMRTATWHWPSD